MAVWSETLLSELAGSLRMDAEYYDPELLRYEQAVKSYNGGWAPLKDITTLITDGDHLKRNYVDKGVLFLTAENFREHSIDYNSDLRIAPDYERTLARARSEAEAIFLTKTGRWYGKAAVCRAERPNFNISADVAKIRLHPDYDPFFLACYFNSAIGYALVRRESTGGSRDRIILDNLRSLPVPRVPRSETKYREIVSLIEEAYSKANTLYKEAQSLLESALGLDKLDLTTKLFFEQPLSIVKTATRYDAEYFQPRMQNLIAALSRSGRTLSDVVKLSKRRFKPGDSGTFQYIEIGNVAGDGTAEASTIHSTEAPSRATWVVRPGDIITSTVRPIRRLTAIITKEQADYVCSSGFAVLTTRNPKEVAPELLLAYLRLPLICELLDLHTTSSMYPAISVVDLMKIPIALPDESTRGKIVAKVQESFEAQRQAQALTERSKAMVEAAILGDK